MEVLKDVFNVLYVDDEENNLNSFRAALRRNYNIYTALSGEEGIEILSKTDIHVIVTDQRMPHMTGVQFLQHIPLSLIHISEPTRLLSISYAVFCLKKKKKSK